LVRAHSIFVARSFFFVFCLFITYYLFIYLAINLGEEQATRGARALYTEEEKKKRRGKEQKVRHTRHTRGRMVIVVVITVVYQLASSPCGTEGRP
jgi:hypothetical protein